MAKFIYRMQSILNIKEKLEEQAKTAEMKRYRKDSFYWYKKVIASNGEDLD